MTTNNSFHQPGEKERLARKQEERLRRLYRLQGRLADLSPRWWVGVGEIAVVIGLLLVSFWLLSPFFGQADQINAFSAPVVPILATAIEGLAPFAYGVRIWLLVFLITFPLTFYYFARDVSGRKLTGLLAAFISILPITPFLSARVGLGIFDQDGSHIASLTITPLVCLLLLRFLRKGNFWTGILSALGTTLVALTSPIGLMVLTVFMGVMTFSEMLLGQGRLKLLRFLIVLLFTAGFSAFWYHPKFVFLTLHSSQGQLIVKTLFNLLPVSFFLLPVLGILGFLLFENQPRLQQMFIAFFLTVGFGLFYLGAGIAHPAPSRFLPAFGISLAFLLGITITWFFDFLRLSPRLKRFKTLLPFRRLIAFGMVGLIAFLILTISVFYANSLWELGNRQVLGLATDKTVGIWDIKEQTSRVGEIAGYAISATTGLVALFLRMKISR